MYGYPVSLIIFTVLMGGVAGTVFGSFLDCMASRTVEKKSFIKGRSQCDSCGRSLKALDLVPVASYVFLRGKCRYCGGRIPARALVVELLCGAGTGLLLFLYAFTEPWLAVKYILLLYILIPMSLVDLYTFEVRNRFLVSMVVLGAALLPFIGWTETKSMLIGAVAVSVPLLLFVLLMDKLLKKETMGGGDIKLFFAIGINLGWKLTLLTLITACVTGLIFALAVKIKNENKDENEDEDDSGSGAIPFAPAVSAAAFIVMCFGSRFVDWYIGLLT